MSRAAVTRWLAAAALIGSGIGQAFAQAPAPTPAEFYAGKTITLICSADAGGAVDLNARHVAKHLARFIPGSPSIVVRNMPGGGHTLAGNFVYNQAPRDGTTIGTFINSMPLHQATSGQGVRFDSTRFNWLGSTGVSNITIMVWHTAGVKTVEDVKQREVVLGATGVGSGTWIYANALNQLVGTRFKLVTGYRGVVDIDLATERGEVQGRSGASVAGFLKEHAEWLKTGKVRPIVQIGLTRDRMFPDVPLLHEIEASDEARQVLKLMSSPVLVGRPYMAPPETPADRVAALRKAFDQAVADPQFRAEAEALAMELNPISGEELAKVVDEIIRSPSELLVRVKPIMGVAEPAKR
jgi:tripartite-type tricarboxylate transporter receptor subunit TctC